MTKNTHVLALDSMHNPISVSELVAAALKDMTKRNYQKAIVVPHLARKLSLPQPNISTSLSLFKKLGYLVLDRSTYPPQWHTTEQLQRTTCNEMMEELRMWDKKYQKQRKKKMYRQERKRPGDDRTVKYRVLENILERKQIFKSKSVRQVFPSISHHYLHWLLGRFANAGIIVHPIKDGKTQRRKWLVNRIFTHAGIKSAYQRVSEVEQKLWKQRKADIVKYAERIPESAPAQNFNQKTSDSIFDLLAAKAQEHQLKIQRIHDMIKELKGLLV